VARYVVAPDVALHLVRDGGQVRGNVQLLAPTLLRSQVLSLLYAAVLRGELSKHDAERQLDLVRRLRLRLLGDRVLQKVAWQVAEQLGWSDTCDAEYVALTRLQADALVTLDARLAAAVEGVVALAPVEALT
jgi:predicted nucleic acid-binding protein